MKMSLKSLKLLKIFINVCKINLNLSGFLLSKKKFSQKCLLCYNKKVDTGDNKLLIKSQVVEIRGKSEL